MNQNRFTEKAQEAIVAAQENARQAGNPEVTGLHLLAALLNQSGGIVPALLPLVNVDPTDLRRRVDQDLAALPRVTGSAAEPQMSQEFRSTIQRAQNAASQMADQYVSVEHLLLALADEANTDRSGDLLRLAGALPDQLREAISNARGGQKVTSPNPEEHLSGAGAVRARSH